jgi:hypothetical protein
MNGPFISDIIAGVQAVKMAAQELIAVLNETPRKQVKKKLIALRKYVGEWDTFITKLQAHNKRAEILGDTDWFDRNKAQIERMGHDLVTLGLEEIHLLGMLGDYLSKHNTLRKALIFKFESDHVSDFEEENPFPTHVTLPKFIEWVHYVGGVIDDALGQLNKHIERRSASC